MMYTPSMPLYVVIVAAGSGTRMGGPVPKQFIPLWGLPILMHTMLAFARWNGNIEMVLVLPQSEIEFWRTLCRKHQFEMKHQMVGGGMTRFESVQRGLNLLSGKGLVAIHDGVRPLTDTHTIDRCFQGAEKYGGTIPVVGINDTVRQTAGQESVVLDRDLLCCVQTPQVFSLPLIKQAYQQPITDKFTDDASVFESAGHTIHLVEGDHSNIKITSPFDLRLAEAIMSHRSSADEDEETFL